jgi:hypothetical protein
MGYTEKLTHVAEGLALLPSQFADKANLATLIEIFGNAIQEIESELWGLHSDRRLDNATGALLDDLGKLVGQDRLGYSDDAYRILIRGRVRARRCNGTPDAILAVLEGIEPDTTYELYEGLGEYMIDATGEPITNSVAGILISLLRTASPVSVRGVLHWQESATSASFVLDNVAGTDPDGLGFAEATPLDGAILAGATSSTVDATTNFTATGSITFDAGTALEETVAYSAKTGTTFTHAATAYAHADRAMITQGGGALAAAEEF